MSGFISIHRKLWDNEIFATEPMSEREAWVWMISRAAWSDTRHRVGSKMVDVPRGSFMVTLRELQSKFGWKSDTKVRSFLAMLEGENMINRAVVGQRNAPKTHVTICNYCEYQGGERTENAPKTHQKRTKNAVKNKTIKEIIDTNVSQRDADQDYFSEFWNAYPHRGGVKKGRKPSELKFIAAIKSGAEPSQLINAAKRYASDRAVLDGYGKNPETWLNQHRWLDEIEAPKLTQIQGGAPAMRIERNTAITKAAATGTVKGAY